jgi:L-glyceraldehyde 3-phosphate reductase
MLDTTTIPRRPLGDSGLTLPILSLGSWHIYDRMHFGDAVAMVRRAVDAGANMFDIGVYGTPETTPPPMTDVLFSAIARGAGLRREDYVLSEKLWLEGFDADKGFRPQLEHALFRVGTDHADLVVLGDVRDPATDLAAVVQSLGELHAEGLISAWGVNNWSATNIEAVKAYAQERAVPGPKMAQLKYSVARRAIPDGDPFAALFAAGLSLQASDVMEGGVLVKPTPPEREVGRDPGEIRGRIEAAARQLAAIAEGFGATPAEICVAFTLTHPALVNTLVGTSKLSQLEQALNAVALVDRIGAGTLRDAVEPLWCDRGIVDPEGP